MLENKTHKRKIMRPSRPNNMRSFVHLIPETIESNHYDGNTSLSLLDRVYQKDVLLGEGSYGKVSHYEKSRQMLIPKKKK